MSTRTKLLSALLSLPCAFALVFAGSTADAQPTQDSMIEVEQSESVELDAEALSCELEEEVEAEGASAWGNCQWTCNMEYNICVAGGAPNCEARRNECMSQCY